MKVSLDELKEQMEALVREYNGSHDGQVDRISTTKHGDGSYSTACDVQWVEGKGEE